jgi:archaemetzincin
MPGRIRWAPVLFAGLIALGPLAIHSAAERPKSGAARPAPTLAQIQAAKKKLLPLHARLARPQPGDWLASHKEAGQSFDQYRRNHPDRLALDKILICVQPIGEFSATQRRLVDDTAEALGRCYGARIKTLDPIPLSDIPATARRTHPLSGEEQILSVYVLDKLLAPRRPPEASAMLAFTATDLWPGEGWNFVFGQASLTGRVGVWSLARYGDPATSDEAYVAALRRTAKVAIHETGHMFGIAHCTAFACGMNGSNSLDETDRTPLPFCPECSAKIWWTCGIAPKTWFAELAEWAARHHLDDEAIVWKDSGAVLGE